MNTYPFQMACAVSCDTSVTSAVFIAATSALVANFIVATTAIFFSINPIRLSFFFFAILLYLGDDEKGGRIRPSKDF